ncbi:hypothetical protein RBU49_15360 [Clostridium sp. MB40-C1]|uniref:hypothetical protein n=1 Tax=Clostridium sp. MB40-C1 TaxID=3070996 RepID=UPI0027E1020A|nr:hypothetical protein [Clostridium sp. MB40-C1]WMJ80182.1 hypothetical protein RBU49_15360 [Clostridium sp. MB40-C1]
MRILLYIIIGIVLFIIFAVIFEKPMDDSGDEFNANIFPFEIKDPKDWYKTKQDKTQKDKTKEDDKDK